MVKDQQKIRDGHKFEIQVFGYSSEREKLKIYKKKKLKGECKQEAKQRALARGWNPKRPGKDLLISKLLDKVREVIEKQGLRYDVRVFPALATELDDRHKIDGFFEAYRGPNHEQARFVKKDDKGLIIPTACFDFDVTLRNKEDRPNVYILKPEDFSGVNLQELAEFIVERFKSVLY